MGRLEMGQPVGHRADDVGGAEHAELDRIDAHILEERVDLQLEKFHRWGMHPGDRTGVLGRQRGDHRAAERAERREGLEVSQHAGAAGGVGAGDGEDVGNGACRHENSVETGGA